MGRFPWPPSADHQGGAAQLRNRAGSEEGSLEQFAAAQLETEAPALPNATCQLVMAPSGCFERLSMVLGGERHHDDVDRAAAGMVAADTVRASPVSGRSGSQPVILAVIAIRLTGA
jgi:hypothetical protein